MKRSHIYAMSKKIVFLFFLCCCSISLNLTASIMRPKYHQPNFSQCLSVVLPNILEPPTLNRTVSTNSNTLLWSQKTDKPFSELILSWNAIRPHKGKFSFFVNIKHHNWSGWRKLAEWGAWKQQTFCNTKNHFVHSKLVRIEMQHGRLANAYQIKVVAHNGANIHDVKALFANISNWKLFTTKQPNISLPSKFVHNVPKKSQWWIKHKRAKDLCSPTSASMIAYYFANKHGLVIPAKNFNSTTAEFAEKVYDHSLDIYGNWLFNVAQTYNITHGHVLYRVERLNDFQALHTYLQRNIPIAVSIRGSLRGCAWPYKNGHFVVVVGWNQKTRRVICIDPAFRNSKQLVRAYHINDFITAWSKSKNLAYVAIPKKSLI